VGCGGIEYRSWAGLVAHWKDSPSYIIIQARYRNVPNEVKSTFIPRVKKKRGGKGRNQ